MKTFQNIGAAASALLLAGCPSRPCTYSAAAPPGTCVEDCVSGVAQCPGRVFPDGGDGAVDAPSEAAPADTTPSDAAPPPGTVLDASAPEPVVVPQWMLADLRTPSAGDPVRAAVEGGSFAVPAMEGSAFGVDWYAQAPDENGVVGTGVAGGYLYAAARVDVAPGQRLFARADTAASVYTNGAQQPGDVYASHRVRVPLAVRPGANAVLVRGLGGRGDVAVQLYSTRDELYLNTEDLTAPELPEGAMTELWLGVAVLNLTEQPLASVTARVEASAQFAATEVTLPAMAPHAVTQLSLRLAPVRPFPAAGQHVSVGVRVSSPSLRYGYRTEVTLDAVAASAAHRRTFASNIDRSAQYYAVLPPSNFDPARDYALVLSLHGASVEALGQARAYAAKDWAYVIAPTNRRPYGFDWEEWGTVDALEVLDHATSSYRVAPDRVYLTGHSMGGHGTWHVGLLFPTRFATLGPSAGWSSFYSYARATMPTGAFAHARAASNTPDFMSNLAHRGAYLIHGTADSNVPIREGRQLFASAMAVTSDVRMWEQVGADHWWDLPGTPGADCVDWGPLFDFMNTHRLDPYELDFRFTSPGAWVSPRHSYVTVRSELDAGQNFSLASARAGDTVTLTTTNVRSLELAGAELRRRGVLHVVLDGTSHDVPDGPLALGPTTGKRPGQHGPMNEAFYRPFCFVYPDAGPAATRQYVSWLTSYWSVQGNGQACAAPLSGLTPALRAAYNLVYVGLPRAQVPVPSALRVSWDDAGAQVGDTRYDGAAMAFVFPEGEHLSAALVAPAGSEQLLFRYMPFTSQSGAPDYFVFSTAGLRTAGFFTPDWALAP